MKKIRKIKIWDTTLPQVYIVNDTDDVKLISVEVYGHNYSFNCDWIPSDKIEWLANIYVRHLTDSHNRAVYKTKKDLQKLIQNIANYIGLK